MDLEKLESFLRVAESGSINRAALELNMTQPALSRRIAALEHELGVRLLARSTHGARLTDAGEKLVQGAPPILRQAQLLRSDLGREPQVQIAIGLPTSMHRLITVPFTVETVTRQPAIRLQVFEAFNHHLRDWAGQGLIDVAIMNFSETPPEKMEQTPLVREQLLLVAPADQGLRLDEPVTADRLAASPLILPGRPNGVSIRVETYLKEHNQRLNRVVEAETLALCLALAKSGLGHAIMPYCTLHEFPELSTLSFAPIEGLFIIWSLCLSQHRQHNVALQRVARSLKDMMRHEVSIGRWRFASWVDETGSVSGQDL